MTAFLAWIYNQAAKVYDWFGSSYSSLRNAASNAWSWAVGQANRAYTDAVNFAIRLFNSVEYAVGITTSWVSEQIRLARNGLLEDIAGLFDWVQYQITQVLNLASQIGVSVWDTVYGLYNQSVDFASALIDQGIQ